MVWARSEIPYVGVEMTCPVCREKGLVSEVIISEVKPVARSVEEKVTFKCAVCTWETEAML